MATERQRIQRNIVRLMQIMLGCFLIIAIRYGILQIWDGPDLAERMESQVRQGFQLQSPRGSILEIGRAHV